MKSSNDETLTKGYFQRSIWGLKKKKETSTTLRPNGERRGKSAPKVEEEGSLVGATELSPKMCRRQYVCGGEKG